MSVNGHPIDWQQIAALAIVAAAAFVVAKRLWGQILAFRSRPARRKSSKAAPARPQPPRPETLVQIQLTPPRHMKRPPTDDHRP